MSGFKRGTAARLLVQVTSGVALHRRCPRCKLERRFVSAGKFRVNAQKKRIDAWLIFRCTACDDRWNWPVHERRPVGALDPTELDALMRNDPDLAARHGQAAMRSSPGAAAENDPTLHLAILEPATDATRVIEIVISAAGASLRLDRLLAQTLALGRREIEALDEAGVMTALPVGRKALRRPAIDGQRIRIDLDGCSAAAAARLRQSLQAQAPNL
jgi:hypothetical protein